MAAVPTSYQFIKAVNNNVVIIGLDGVTPVVQYSLQPGKDLKIDERNPDNVLIPVEESKGAQNKFLSISYKKMDFANSSPSATNPADITEALDFLSSDFFFELGGGSGGDTYWEVENGFGSTLTNVDKNTDILLLRGDLGNDFIAVYLKDQRLLVFNQNGTMISSRNINNIANTEITLPEYADDSAADADVNLENGSLYKITGSRAIYQKP